MKFFKDTNTKPFAIAIAVCLLLLVGFSIWFSFLPSQNHLYAKSAQVVSLDYKNDFVTIKDVNGFCWIFSGCEDWIIALV